MILGSLIVETFAVASGTFECGRTFIRHIVKPGSDDDECQTIPSASQRCKGGIFVLSTLFFVLCSWYLVVYPAHLKSYRRLDSGHVRRRERGAQVPCLNGTTSECVFPEPQRHMWLAFDFPSKRDDK